MPPAVQAPSGSDSYCPEIPCWKASLDGFSVERFYGKEAHFQFGWAMVSCLGEIMADCNSRSAFIPIAKAVDKEENAIPVVLKRFNECMVSNNIRSEGDKLVVDGDGEIFNSLQLVLSMDYKAWALALGRMGAGCTRFCCWNMLCHKDTRGSQVEKVPATSTWGTFLDNYAVLEGGMLHGN